MKTFLLAALAATASLPTVAAAQDTPAFQPYLGVLLGRESFDSEANKAGIPNFKGNVGGLVEAVGGINLNLGDVLVVGAEGNVAKGGKGTIDWEYGVAGRVGVRAGTDSLFFGKVGRRWIKLDFPNSPTYDGMTYGLGVDWSARDMGADPHSAISHMKVRFQADTFGNFRSIRPMAGVLVGF